MYIVPQRIPAPRAAAIPKAALAGAASCEDATASSVAPANMQTAPPITPNQRFHPAACSSLKSRNPQKIPRRLLVFQRGKAMLRPTLRIAYMVSVLATAHMHPARIAQTTRCGAWATSLRICAVPRTSAGTLHRARKTPQTITSETVTGEISGLTSLMGASAPPSHAPAAKPQNIPNACRLRRRLRLELGSEVAAVGLGSRELTGAYPAGRLRPKAR